MVALSCGTFDHCFSGPKLDAQKLEKCSPAHWEKSGQGVGVLILTPTLKHAPRRDGSFENRPAHAMESRILCRILCPP